jgi:hypothetical protein
MRTVVTIAMIGLSLVLFPYAPSHAAGKGSLAVSKAAADKGKAAEKGKGADTAGKSDPGTKGQTKDSPK